MAFARKPNQEWFFRSGLRALRTHNWAGPRQLRVLRLAARSAAAFTRAPREFLRLARRAWREDGFANRVRMLNRLLPFAGARFDVLYFPWNSAAIDYLPLYELGRPVVVSCRGSQINVAPHDPRRELREGLPVTFERAAVVHCVSEAIEHEAEQFGLDRRKARMIHPGIDPEFFSPPQRREPAPIFRIVTVGSFVWVKGTTYALQALRQLVDRGVSARLALVGDGVERQRILYTIDDLDLWDYVELSGRLPPIAVRDRLRASDAFLLTSLSEGFCNAAVEAMGCGLPVVMTNCGGVREGVTDGLEGFIVPLRDATGCANALEKLARDPELRRRMGEAGRQRVLRQFTLQRHVRQFVSLLEEASSWRVA
jgi:colanic acid/amylovoran biosynthesis glycosyltransferase